MIISCPNCIKQFKINPSLIPINGRDLKCGSCDHVWFYKIEDIKTEPLPLRDDFADKEIKDEIDNKIVDNINETNDLSSHKDIDERINKTDDKITEKQKPVKNKIKKNTRRGSIIENKRRSPVKNNRGKKVDRKRRN